MHDIIIQSQLIDSVGPAPQYKESGHGTITGEFPVVVRIPATGIALASHSTLPLACSSVDHVTCTSALEFVRDDEQLLAEISRVLRPEGRLELRVPNALGTGRFDHLNVYRYIRDITKRGARPPELAEVGWRRHYRRDEITSFLESSGLEVLEMTTSGTGISEAGDLVNVLRTRWLRNGEKRNPTKRCISAAPQSPHSVHRNCCDLGWYLQVLARRRK